jgi:hypothetical protein
MWAAFEGYAWSWASRRDTVQCACMCAQVLGSGNEYLDKCQGTPAFLAPEMMRPHSRYRCAHAHPASLPCALQPTVPAPLQCSHPFLRLAVQPSVPAPLQCSLHSLPFAVRPSVQNDRFRFCRMATFESRVAGLAAAVLRLHSFALPCLLARPLGRTAASSREPPA